jgi:hypothetical protein
MSLLERVTMSNIGMKTSQFSLHESKMTTDKVADDW